MKPSTCLVAAALVLAGGVFVGGQSPESKQDLARMNGTWSARFLEISGKALNAEEQAKIKVKLFVSGNTYKVFFDDKQVSAGVMALDAAKKPKTIDAFPSEGPDKGKVQPGIYMFVGEEMRVVFADPGKARPIDFKSRPGTDEVLISYQRLKTK